MSKRHSSFFYGALTFALCGCTGLVVVLIFQWKGGGIFYLGSDFVEQQIPFWIYCSNAIKTGQIWWSAANDLGTSFIGAFSYYGIGSPFFLLSLLLPTDSLHLYFGYLLVLKMAVAGLGGYLYCRQYLKTPVWAVTAGLLYAFCGYQMGNMHFHFYDMTALFPFLLLALDQAFLHGKKGGFACMVAVSAACNAVLFVGEVVFLVLYTVVKLLCRAYRLSVKKLAVLAFESLAGVGLSGVLLLPTVYSMLGNPRAMHMGYYHLRDYFILKPLYLAAFVRSSLFPAESFYARGFFVPMHNVAELYLPLFGMVLVAAFVMGHKSHWLSRALLTSLVFAVVPVLNSAFNMFNYEYYPRWLYMPSLLCVLATALALEERSLSLKPGYVLYGLLWVGMGAIWLIFTRLLDGVFISNLLLVGVLALLSLSGFVCTLFLRRAQTWTVGPLLIVGLVMAHSMVDCALVTYYTQRSYAPQAVADYYTAPQLIDTSRFEDGYRMDSAVAFANLSMILRHASTSNFNSCISGSAFAFYDAIDMPRSVTTKLRYAAHPELLQAFFSTRYLITYQDGYSVTENENALPMGYCFDSYVLRDELDAFTGEQKQQLLLKTLILEQPPQTAALAHADAQQLLQSPPDLKTDVAQRAANTASEFRYTADGFTAVFTGAAPELVFFTVPYDAGWQAYVDDVRVEIVKADYGFMAIPTHAGQNSITLVYRPVGWRAGCAVSTLSLMLLAVYVCLPCTVKKKNAGCFA